MTETPLPDLEAILLVGGQGTRLRPLTLGTPKPLLPTAGVPFLAHQLARARSFGVRRIVFATSYRAEMFSEAFGDGAAFGLSLEYMTEETPLGTGGAIRNAAQALTCGPDAPVLVLNGDILSGHDIADQVATHVARKAAVTLHLTEVDDPSRFGCVPTDETGRVTAFLEKTPNPVTNRINAGCYVFTRSVIDTIPAGQVVSVERETFPGLIEDGALVLGYADASYWLDVGTPAAFVKGSRDLVLGRLVSPALPGPPGDFLALPGAMISAEAKVAGGSVIGARAIVESGAQVSGSVLGDDCVVDSGAVVVDSVVGIGARVHSGAVLRDVIVGDGAVVGPGNELLAGSRVWPGVVLPESAIRFSSDI
ncbi:mannose-1-phosphate guanylyltransferase [Streptosporangium becharense]|uniref:Mannose-1-phosphate guanylyltransferase n=1 Tax=Streptosporangium becharense TaxID=1816182 RepID=A0A7W9IF51_9ACTN|nr:NDP-sugar synthase [Streptosporangium becharense]MBB2909694.1 mannose-1-phosphate guanylyltransferase [Streptosporangium becharense]MBB5819350.1 mannose-1-phosphate guanylyltransferase [Streptosporangium becharense]